MVKPHCDVVSTELENKEAVLLHLGTKKYYSLNETGLCIWRMLANGNTPGRISEGLRDEFDIPAVKANESVINLLKELLHEKLIEIA